MPYDKNTGQFRAYSEDELKQLRPDWFPKTSSQLMQEALGKAIYPMGIGPGTTGWTDPPKIPTTPTTAGPSPTVPQTPGFSLFPQTPIQQPPAGANPFKPVWQDLPPVKPNPIQQPPAGPNPIQQPPAAGPNPFQPFWQNQIPPTQQPAAGPNPFKPFWQDIAQASPNPPVSPQSFGDRVGAAWGGVKQFAGEIDRNVQSALGFESVDKFIMGKDVPKMSAEYSRYYQTEKNRGGQPLDPEEYFRSAGYSNSAILALNPSDVQKIQVEAGAIDNQLSGGAKDWAAVTGQVLGQAGVLKSGLGQAGTWAASKVMANPLLKKAPAWIQKSIGSITGAATMGVGYQAYMEGLEEAAHPERQTLGGHLQDVGETGAYWTAYGAVSGPVQKILQKLGGTKALQGVGDAMGKRMPATTEIGKSVIEGGLSGAMVGVGMFGLEFMKSGDVAKSWAALTDEAKGEMQENFAQSILYAFMRRGGKMTAPQRDVLDDMYDEVYDKLSSDMKGEWDTVIQYAVDQGHDAQTAKSVILDYYSQSQDGEISLHKASEQLFAKQFENTVIQAQAQEDGNPNAVAATQPADPRTTAFEKDLDILRQMQQFNPSDDVARLINDLQAQIQQIQSVPQNDTGAVNLMEQSAAEEQTRVKQMMDALNVAGGQEAQARKQVDPVGVLEGYTAVPQPEGPELPITSPVQQQSGLAQGPRQVFSQGETVRLEGKPGLYQVVNDQEGRKRKLIGPDGSAVEVAPPSIRKFAGHQPGDQVTVDGKEGIYTIQNTRDGKTIRLTAPNGTVTDLPASKIKPYFSTPAKPIEEMSYNEIIEQIQQKNAGYGTADEATRERIQAELKPLSNRLRELKQQAADKRQTEQQANDSKLIASLTVGDFTELKGKEDDWVNGKWHVEKVKGDIVHLERKGERIQVTKSELTALVPGLLRPQTKTDSTPPTPPETTKPVDDERMSDSIGGSPITLDTKEDEIDTTGEPAAVWKQMRDKLALSGPTSPQHKVKLLNQMKEYAAQHGFEWIPRYQELLDKFSKDADSNKQAKQEERETAKEEAKKREEQQKKKEESAQRIRQDLVEHAKKFNSYESFRRENFIGNVPYEVRGSQSVESFLRDVYAEAHGESRLADRNPLKDRIGETVTFENSDGIQITGTLTSIIDDQLVGVVVPYNDGKDTMNWKVYADEISFPESAAAEPKQDPKQDKKTMIENLAVGDVVTITGRGDLRFTITELKNRGFISLRAEAGGTMEVHRQAVSSIVDKAGDNVNVNENVSDDAAQVLQRQFYALSPNPDEIEAIRKSKPPNILVSYGTWGEQAGRTNMSIKQLIDSLGYEPTVIADNGAFTNFNSGRDARLYEVMAFYQDELDMEPEDVWHDLMSLKYGDDTMHDVEENEPVTAELDKLLKTAREIVAPVEALEFLEEVYQRAKDGETDIDPEEEANAIWGPDGANNIRINLVKNFIAAGKKDGFSKDGSAKKGPSRWPDFYHFIDWLGTNNSVIDYVMAPDILTKGQEFTDTVEPVPQSLFGKGAAKYDVDGEYIQQLANFTYRVMKEGGYETIPVFQFFSDHKYLDELIAEGADYIAIATNSDWSKNKGGGTKADRAAYVRNIVQKYAKSGVKFHLLGTNDPELIDMIGPGLYSADGTTWQFSMRKEGVTDRAEAGAADIAKREGQVEARKKDAQQKQTDFKVGDKIGFVSGYSEIIGTIVGMNDEGYNVRWTRFANPDGTDNYTEAFVNRDNPTIYKPESHSQPLKVGDFVRTRSYQISNGHFGGFDYQYVTKIEKRNGAGEPVYELGGYGRGHVADELKLMNDLPENIRQLITNKRKDRNYGVTYNGGRMFTVYTNAVIDAYENGRPLPEEPSQKTIDAVFAAFKKVTDKDYVYQKQQGSRQHDAVHKAYFDYEFGNTNRRIEKVSILEKSRDMKVEYTDTTTGEKGAFYVTSYNGDIRNEPSVMSGKERFITDMPPLLRDSLDQSKPAPKQEQQPKNDADETESSQPISRGSITLWVPHPNHAGYGSETREIYSDVQGLIKRLRELNEIQLREIAKAYSITGHAKQKYEALPMFIADALIRDKFQIPQKGIKEIFDKSMAKIKGTVTADQFKRIQRMVDKFMNNSVDYRIDQVLFNPLDGKGVDGVPAVVAINYTDLKTDQKYSILLGQDGKAIDKFTGHSMVRDYPKKLAEWTWDNYARTVMPVGEANWIGWTLHDKTRAKRAADVRESINAAKWKNNRPELNGADNDPDFAGPLDNMGSGEPAASQQQEDTGAGVDYDRTKTYTFKPKQDKPIQDYDYNELVQEVVDLILDTTGIRSQIEDGNKNQAIGTFKNAMNGFIAAGAGVKVEGYHTAGPDDQYTLEISVPPKVMPYSITNFRDLLNQFVFKSVPLEQDPLPKFKFGSKVQVMQNDGTLRDGTYQGRYSDVRFYVRYEGEEKDTLVEPGRIQQDGVKSNMLFNGRAVYFDGPDGEEIGGLYDGRPPGVSWVVVKGFDGQNYRPMAEDIRLEPRGHGEQAPTPPQDAAPPERTLKPLNEDPEKVTPEDFAAYVTAARYAIDKLREQIQANTLPTTQAGLRKTVGDLIGRPPTEDEWSDLLEAAIQEHAATATIPEQDSWYDRTLRYIELGEQLEKLMKNAGRSIEKGERMQFSTPIPLSAIATYALDAKEGETVKEGSAGTGSLALPVKVIYGANVKAVELSPRRAAILTALGIEVQNENTFDVKSKVNAVIGNPPFRGQNVGKGTVAFAGNPPWKGGWGDLGNRFLAWDLRSIPDGGRLVYIVSPGVIDGRQNAEFRSWLEENHTVQAMVKIHEGGYDSRGTSFGAGVIVVDKGKEVIALKKPITGTAETWTGLLEMLKPVGEDGSYGRVEVASDAGGRRDGGNTAGGTSTGGRGGSGGGSSGGRPGSGSTSGNSGVGSRSGSDGGTKPRREESTPGGNDTVSDERTPDVVDPQQPGIQDGVSPQDQAARKPVVERIPRKPKEQSDEDAGPDVSGFVEYVPQGGLSGRAHLGQVVETGNLSMIKYPDEIFKDPEYRPHDILLKAEGAQKKLSDVQLETVHLAKYNWHQDKRSLWIADDTGVGKTGSQMANAADAWHTGRAKRILVITTTDQVATADIMAANDEFALKLPMTHVNSDSHDNFKDSVIEADKNRKDHEKRWTPLPVGDGVMVMSKYTFSTSQKAVREWFNGIKDDLLVLVDEAHEFSNMGSGGEPSDRALALSELYRDYNDRAQFIYSSATGAENLDEMQYMYGLGLWGNAEEFGDFKTRLKGYEPSRSNKKGQQNQSAMGKALGNTRNPFEREIPLAMMEQMIRELKSEGQYIGRSLSMEGVALEALPIQLSPKEIGEYNRAVEFISRIADKAEEHNEAVGRGRIMGGVVGYMRRLRGFYAMRAIIRHMKEEEAAGRLSRFVLSGEFKSGDENEDGPAMLSAAIRAINDQATAQSGGRTVKTTIPEAVSDKEELLEMLAGNHADYDFQKPVPDLPSPIKMLYDAFGDDKVLVITGDVKKVERPAVVKNFQQGKTKVIYFNSAANTGISLHDTIGNQIGFYHVDYPYNAKSAKQSEGRSNRTGQVTKPVIFYPYIVGSLDTKFVGTLLSRSASMGAMSRGKANKMGDGELDNFEFSGDAAKFAVERLVPLLDDETRAKMFGSHAARLPEDPETGEVNPAYIKTLFGGDIDVKKFINYIMYLDFEEGGRVIEQYGEAYKEAIALIEAAGGVVEKFRTFNGREIDKAEGGNVVVRHIETILKPAEEAALQRRLETAEEQVDAAEDVLAETTREIMEKISENLEKAKEKRDEANAELDELMEQARELRKPENRSVYTESTNLSSAKQARLRAITDADKAAADAVIKQREKELADAEKRRDDADAKYEKISKRLEKVREEQRKADEKYNSAKRWADLEGELLDANLETLPAYRRAKSSLDGKKTRLENVKAEIESNTGATLIEGQIATTGLMVPIRAALRAAAQDHYGTQDPPAKATTVELRGYQLQDGSRAVGVIIPTWAEQAVLERLNVRFAYSGESGDMKALMLHIQKGNDIELEGGFTLSWRPRDKVVAIKGMTRGRHVDLFNQLQGNTEDFGFIAQSGMFIVQNEAGLGRLLQRFPVKGMEQDADEAHAMATVTPGGTPNNRRGPRKPKTPPTVQAQVKKLIDTKNVLTPKTSRAIVDILADGLDTLVYSGRVKRGAEGVYNHLKSKAIAVREKHEDRWRVVGHELGHAFSRMHQRIGNKQELIDLMEGIHPGADRYPDKKKPEEGFAEFFRLWVADPDLAEQYAPKTTALFEQYIASDPVLEPMFAKIRLIVDNDLVDSPTARAVAGAISSEYRADESDVQGPQYEVGEGRLPGMRQAERTLFRVADFTIPARDLDRALEKAGKNPKVSLRRLMSVMGDNRAKALLTFSSIPQDHAGRHIKGAVLQDLYELGIKHVIGFMGNKKINLASREIKENVTKATKPLYNKYRKMGAKDAFDALLLAMRIRERYETGKYQDGTLPLTREHADEIYAEAQKNYPLAIVAAEKLTARYSDVLLKMMVAADVITEETADNVKKGSSNYIPFFYVDAKTPAISGSKEFGRTNRQPVKQFKGQVKPTLDAFQSMMLKLMEVHQAIEHKRVMNLLHEMAETGETKHFMRMLPAKTDAVRIQSDQVIQQIFDATDVDLSGALQNIDHFKFFVPNKTLDRNKPTIMNVKDGKAVEIEMAKDLFDSVMALKPVQVQAFGRFIRWVTRVQRFTGLVTLRYVFSTALLRDPGAVLMQSDRPHQTFRYALNALGAIFGVTKKGKQLHESFVNSGAASGAMENMLRNIGRNNFGDEILRLPAAGWGKVRMGTKRMLVRIWESPSEMMRVLEEGPRIAEYLQVWKHEVTELGYDANEMWDLYRQDGTDALPKPLQRHMERILVDAAYKAREVTTNFGMHGTSEVIRKYVPTVPFLQGSLQGFYRFVRQVKAHPVKTPLMAATTWGLLSYLSYAIMSGVINALGDDDDEIERRKQDYMDMDSSMKDKYWWFPVAPGVYMAMAKPFEYAIPANMFERLLEQNSGEAGTRNWNSDMRSLLGTMTNLDTVNNIVNVWIDLASNRNSFGGDIVPFGEQGDPKNLQAGPETSLTARYISNFMTDIYNSPSAGPSPREMDYAVRGIFGRYGTGALNALDAAWGLAQGENLPGASRATKPVGGSAHVPVLGQVLYDRSELGGSRLIDRFYRDLELSNKYASGAVELQKHGNTQLPGWATDRGLELLRANPMLDEIQATMSQINGSYKTAINDTSKTPSERERYRLQLNYWRELLAGIPYGRGVQSPAPVTGLNDADSEQVLNTVMANIQDRINGELRSKGGATEHWQYYMALKNGPQN